MTGSTSTRLVYPLITVKSENIMPVCHRALELADPKVAAVTIENDLNLRRPKYYAAA
jgi:hypothetical protein